MNVYLIIPVKNPKKEFLKIVNFFINKFKIIIIDDGSENNKHYFKKLQNRNLKILVNKKNRGKGFSVKKALKNILDSKHNFGAVIADADGQHSIKDINKFCKHLYKKPNQLIIGQREFSIRNTPLRNYTGNKISTFLFFLKYKKVIDTQCGLRGIPYRIFRASLKIKEDNYAFEQKFLNKFFNLEKNLKFIKIKTIYNKKIRSHFKPVRDSLSVIKSLIK